MPTTQESVQIDRNYTNRNGYDPNFVTGVRIPLPDLARLSLNNHAPLKSHLNNYQDGELFYQHFSIRVHREHKLAIFTATNIDGANYVDIDRDTGEPKSAQIEAREEWFDDDRMESKYYLPDSFYSKNSRFFDRGHLTRRLEPTWGATEEAVRANADTFHLTNCSPQHWRFNQTTKYWHGLERFVLENGAQSRKKRVSVFKGPIFDDPDETPREIDGVKVPMRFWKVVVWEGGKGLQSCALIASQARLIDEPRKTPAQIGEETKINLEFRFAISKVEELTKLDFSPVRTFDTFESPVPVGEGVKPSYKPIRDFNEFLGLKLNVT